MHVAFFSGDITRSGGTENVSIMLANALVSEALLPETSSQEAGGASAPSAGPSRKENAGGVFRRGTSDSESDNAARSASGIAERAVSHSLTGGAYTQPPLKLSFISLFEENPKPFFPIDSRVTRHTVYPTVTHGIQHYFDTVRRLKTIVKEQRVDILVDIDGILDMYSLPLKRSTGVKVISWEHFNYHQNPGVPYRKLTRRWAARKADAIVTLTEADRKLYECNTHPKCPVIAIPNPMQRITPEPVYDVDSRTIISSGRLTYQKGFDMLVDVAARVLPQHPDWRWLILGEGEDRPMLEQKITQANLGKQLILTGRVDNMADYYRKAAMFVMTSRFEGLPMVLLEAKAHKLPIVSFDCETGPAEIVTDGVNGELVAPGDIADMAGRIDLLIDDEERRVRYAIHAWDDADRFSKALIVRQWSALLNSHAICEK
ncbi:glycosyltransferase family 4 protein [Bifidobacterium amazonense]|uniref:Glycosyltransferase family 4 protein n=1 Tax=Bifidobacterium amazonense TaxID=2809027 RepID=A0ABS9VS91_9BIFI|nr:glycosyltransferase family 4 protein [Bifidobacterium amazonense]